MANSFSMDKEPGWDTRKKSRPAPESSRKNCIARFFTPRAMLVLFTCINLVNYLDRGIVPGEPKQVGAFIQTSLHVNSTDVEIGALQSSFIAGYAVSSLVFGHLVHYYNPFLLMSIGLGMWCCAVVASGMAPDYWVLLAARICSGVGEASFQTTVPPWLDDNAPAKSRSLWLAVFFSAIPVGYAFGYIFGSQVATATGSWRTAFYLETIIMFPMACILPFLQSNAVIKKRRMSIVDMDGELTAAPADMVAAPTVWEEFKVVVKNPVYICVVLGYAAYTFVTAGFANFGPIFLLGLGFFTKETSASLMFGAVVVVAGFLGTAVGGWILDKWVAKQLLALREANPGATEAEREVMENDCKLYSSLMELTVFGIIGFAFCVFAPFIKSVPIFFLLLGGGILFLFATTAATNVAVMAAVPAGSRSFAIGLSTIIMHGFGDVPSPTIIGVVADALAPACPDGEGPSTPCGKGRVSGLQMTLFLLILWLAWMVLFWGGGWLIKRYKMKKQSQKQDLSYSLMSDSRTSAL